MQPQSVIAIFDIGRTNKKRLLFSERYELLEELNVRLPETVDEDGFPAEDLGLLSEWLQQSFSELLIRKDLRVCAVNVSAYGASFVHLDSELKTCAPLYNYLKPFPENLQARFNSEYDWDGGLAAQTASPELGSLNSGMQLYWLKKNRPEIFERIRYSLHLPQYISFLLSGFCATELTSIGCHTRLWDFTRHDYHQWVKAEGLLEKFPAVYGGDYVSKRKSDGIAVGIGLHDSSSALIPYLSVSGDPFLLISTGTWSISLNPFNHSPLTTEELRQDCLCYLSFQGKPVKAARLFAGHDHDEFVKKLAVHFQCAEDHYLNLLPDEQLLQRWSTANDLQIDEACNTLSGFINYADAYHAGMVRIMRKQKKSTALVLEPGRTKKIFVDGGFSKNRLFLHLLARSFPEQQVYAASLAHASALGAALAIHFHWHPGPAPERLPELKPVFATQTV
ncbi:MAG TPA: FGGY family carbohydrate kinase [Puia sp.]|nr:FGGY family carbohydrate kinase [Puia sp.]